MACMAEVAGFEQLAKLTGSQVYSVIQKAIFANTIPGKRPKQTPRILLEMLSKTARCGDSDVGATLSSDLRLVNPCAVLGDAQIRRPPRD